MPKDTKITISGGGISAETTAGELNRIANRLPKRLTSAQAENLATRLVAESAALLREHAADIIAELEKSRAESVDGTVKVKLDVAIEHGTSTFTIVPVLEWKREIKFKKEGETDTFDLRQLELFQPESED